MTYQGETRENTQENVKKFWVETAEKLRIDPRATIRDLYFQQLEEKN